MTRALLTRRALLDVGDIDAYSTEHWGERVAEQYLADVYSTIKRLEESPGLLTKRPQYSLKLRFYPVREHMLVCDLIDDHLYVLTIMGGNMDLLERISDLEPQLLQEARILRDRIRGE